MRLFSLLAIGMTVGFGGLYGEIAGDEHSQEIGIKDYDQQISLLKQEVTKYNSLANQFDRKASQLRSRDYSGYRSAAELRDRCRSIAADLQKHLEELEKQENALLEAQKRSEKKSV